MSELSTAEKAQKAADETGTVQLGLFNELK